MKKTNLFLLWIIFLASCSPNGFNITPKGTQTSLVFYTLTTVPSRTPIPTLILPTSYPTLPIEIQNEFYELLRTNGHCEFPCFLGVIPGETSFGQAISSFERYEYDRKLSLHKVNFSSPWQWYTADFSIDQNNRNISFYVDLQFIDDTITGLIVNFQPVKGPDGKSDTNSELLVRYDIVELFKKHGVPDQIYLDPTRIRQTQSAYGIEIVYQNEKILSRYSGSAKLAENGKYEMCPSLVGGDIDWVDLAFADPDNPEVNMVQFMHGSFNKDFNLDTYGENRLEFLDTQKIFDLFMQQGERCFYEDEFWLK